MKACEGFLLREIAGEYVLIPVGDTALRMKGMVCLTESAAILWKALQEEQTFETLVDRLLDEYDTDSETARRDVEEFLQKAREVQLLED